MFMTHEAEAFLSCKQCKVCPDGEIKGEHIVSVVQEFILGMVAFLGHSELSFFGLNAHVMLSAYWYAC